MSDSIPPVALTIAGSDSGGGAGIQADLKTFTALRVFGTTAITSITSQNTLGVHAVRELPPDTVHSQIVAVMDDLHPAAVKSGMLSNAAIIEAVAEELSRYQVKNYVLDPVMVSETGHCLLDPAAVETLRRRLFPLALVVTPNRHEAQALTGLSIDTEADMSEAARRIFEWGPRFVLVKGGHMSGEDAVDILFDGARHERLAAPRVDTRNTHGTGCTYAAAITAYLAHGKDVLPAVTAAKQYTTAAIRNAFVLGSGPGPLDHFWNVPTQ